jgi:hypothetical protein
MIGPRWLILGSLVLALAAVQQPAQAENGDPAETELWENRVEARQDLQKHRRPIREGEGVLRGQKRELRKGAQTGTEPRQLARDRQKLREDRRDLQQDRRDLRHDTAARKARGY